MAQECEERVALLTERSGQLEHSGRAAKHDAATVREELEEARKALAIGKAGADALSTRLGSLEQEYLEALKAREELRHVCYRYDLQSVVVPVGQLWSEGFSAG